MKPQHKRAENNLKKSLMTRYFPKCFDSREQYEEWLEQETIAHTMPFRRNICEDCTLEYKSAMVLSSRCVNIAVVVEK